VPDRLLLNTQTKNLRDLLLNKQSLMEILTFEENVFKNAVVDSIIISFKNKITKSEYTIRTKNKICSKDLENIDYINIPSTYFNNTPNSQFNLNYNLEENALINKILFKTKILGDISDIRDGIIQSKIPDVLFLNKKIDKYSKPLLFGKNINKYILKFDNNWVNYKPDEMMKIEKSRIKKGSGIGLRMRTPEIFEREKILTRQTADTIIATIDNDNYYYSNTIHGTTITDNSFQPKYVLAVLNSSLINWYYHFTTSEEGKVFAQIKINLLRLLPIKNAVISIQNKFINIADKILNLTKQEDYLENINNQNKVKEYEEQIDIMVYKLYELTYEEVLTIDKDFKLSKEEFSNFKL
jgi:hypothetical protein